MNIIMLSLSLCGGSLLVGVRRPVSRTPIVARTSSSGISISTTSRTKVSYLLPRTAGGRPGAASRATRPLPPGSPPAAPRGPTVAPRTSQRPTPRTDLFLSKDCARPTTKKDVLSKDCARGPFSPIPSRPPRFPFPVAPGQSISETLVTIALSVLAT